MNFLTETFFPTLLGSSYILGLTSREKRIFDTAIRAENRRRGNYTGIGNDVKKNTDREKKHGERERERDLRTPKVPKLE